MTTSLRIPPNRTTLWGGAGLALSGLIGVLTSLSFTLQLTDGLASERAVPLTTAHVVTLLATVILAFGVGRESGIVGTSIAGKVALLIFGGGYLLFRLVDLLPSSQPPGVAATVFFGTALELLFIAAGVVAGVVVMRAKVLRGTARWMLLVVALWNVLWSAPSFIPSAELGLTLGTWHLEVFVPSAQLVLGVTYVLHGRTAAIRRRLQVINENW